MLRLSVRSNIPPCEFIASGIVIHYSSECEVDYTLLQLLQRDRLFTRFTDSAVDCVFDNNCLVDIFLAAIDAQDEWSGFDVVLAYSPATKTTGRMRGTITMNAVHFFHASRMVNMAMVSYPYGIRLHNSDEFTLGCDL